MLRAGEIMMALSEIAILNVCNVVALFARAEAELWHDSWLKHADFQVSTLVRNVVMTLSTAKETIAASACGMLVRELKFLIVILGYKFRGCKRKLYCLFCLPR